MTASVNILRGDLHLALSTAFNRGRYVLMTAGDGSPLEITIDLKERDDDGFDGDTSEAEAVAHMEQLRDDRRRFAAAHATDDHGPSIPRQETDGAPLRFAAYPPTQTHYEFALQDCFGEWGQPATLDAVFYHHAPDIFAADRADWVHVYDRVTRERRTLKRPAPDAVLTGLRDVAADLRGRTATGYPFDQDGVTAVSVESLRGAPVEPPFGCKPRD